MLVVSKINTLGLAVGDEVEVDPSRDPEVAALITAGLLVPVGDERSWPDRVGSQAAGGPGPSDHPLLEPDDGDADPG